MNCRENLEKKIFDSSIDRIGKELHKRTKETVRTRTVVAKTKHRAKRQYCQLQSSHTSYGEKALSESLWELLRRRGGPAYASCSVNMQSVVVALVATREEKKKKKKKKLPSHHIPFLNVAADVRARPCLRLSFCGTVRLLPGSWLFKGLPCRLVICKSVHQESQENHENQTAQKSFTGRSQKQAKESRVDPVHPVNPLLFFFF